MGAALWESADLIFRLFTFYACIGDDIFGMSFNEYIQNKKVWLDVAKTNMEMKPSRMVRKVQNWLMEWETENAGGGP